MTGKTDTDKASPSKTHAAEQLVRKAWSRPYVILANLNDTAAKGAAHGDYTASGSFFGS